MSPNRSRNYHLATTALSMCYKGLGLHKFQQLCRKGLSERIGRDGAGTFKLLDMFRNIFESYVMPLSISLQA